MSFKGKKNVYLCTSCGRGTITLDLDEGTTPFMTSCITEGCDSMMTSCFYKIPQEILVRCDHALEWYKPSVVEFTRLNDYQRDHVTKGGLLSRVVK